jgi:hypothetical protein
MKQVSSLAWEIFEAIHGNRMQRVLYNEIPCVLNGFYEDQASIMPANPKIDIGRGPGRTIFISKYLIEYITN